MRPWVHAGVLALLWGLTPVSLFGGNVTFQFTHGGSTGTVYGGVVVPPGTLGANASAGPGGVATSWGNYGAGVLVVAVDNSSNFLTGPFLHRTFVGYRAVGGDLVAATVVPGQYVTNLTVRLVVTNGYFDSGIGWVKVDGEVVWEGYLPRGGVSEWSGVVHESSSLEWGVDRGSLGMSPEGSLSLIRINAVTGGASGLTLGGGTYSIADTSSVRQAGAAGTLTNVLAWTAGTAAARDDTLRAGFGLLSSKLDDVRDAVLLGRLGSGQSPGGDVAVSVTNHIVVTNHRPSSNVSDVVVRQFLGVGLEALGGGLITNQAAAEGWASDHDGGLVASLQSRASGLDVGGLTEGSLPGAVVVPAGIVSFNLELFSGAWSSLPSTVNAIFRWIIAAVLLVAIARDVFEAARLFAQVQQFRIPNMEVGAEGSLMGFGGGISGNAGVLLYVVLIVIAGALCAALGYFVSQALTGAGGYFTTFTSGITAVGGGVGEGLRLALLFFPFGFLATAVVHYIVFRLTFAAAGVAFSLAFRALPG